MPWLQLRIDITRDYATAIEDAVLAAGAVSVTLEDNADQPILEPALGETPLWNETRVTGLFTAEIDTSATIRTAATHFGGPLPNHRWELLEDKDWEREWMKNYHPIQCGETFWVCPSWSTPPDPQAINLLLDPGLAFGTGTHPTTFLCLQWLTTQPLREKTIVDYGCGSGILGIAALLLGAHRVTGIDIDPQALIASRANLARNGLAPERFTVHLPSNCPNTPVDLVLANILAGPLAELAPNLIALTRPGGRLCLSGILAAQAEEVMRAYGDEIEFDSPASAQAATKEEWVRLTGFRRQKTEDKGQRIEIEE